MRLVLEAAKQAWSPGEEIVARLVVVNDSHEAIAIDRRLLVGPNVSPEQPTGAPLPIAVEPAFEDERANEVVLGAGCLYGRERRYSGLPRGRVVVFGYLLGRATDRLLPEGPADEGAVRQVAEPLVLRIG